MINSYHIDKNKLKPKIVIQSNGEKFEWLLFFGWGKQPTARSPRLYTESHRCRERAKRFIERFPVEVTVIDKVKDRRKKDHAPITD